MHVLAGTSLAMLHNTHEAGCTHLFRIFPDVSAATVTLPLVMWPCIKRPPRCVLSRRNVQQYPEAQDVDGLMLLCIISSMYLQTSIRCRMQRPNARGFITNALGLTGV